MPPGQSAMETPSMALAPRLLLFSVSSSSIMMIVDVGLLDCIEAHYLGAR